MPHFSTGAMRDTLLKKIAQLSPLELSVLQVLSVVAEPVTNSTVREICLKAGLPLHDETGNTPLPSLAPQLRRLRALHLADENNQIDEAIHESIARRLFADTQTRVTPPAAPKEPNTRRGMPTGHPAYVEAVKKNQNGTWTLRISHTNYDRKCHLDLDATVLFDPKRMTASFTTGPWGTWAKDLKALGFILR